MNKNLRFFLSIYSHDYYIDFILIIQFPLVKKTTLKFLATNVIKKSRQFDIHTLFERERNCQCLCLNKLVKTWGQSKNITILCFQHKTNQHKRKKTKTTLLLIFYTIFTYKKKKRKLIIDTKIHSPSKIHFLS